MRAPTTRALPGADEGTARPPPGGPRAVLGALRAHQWSKNVLVFLPAVAGRQIGHPGVLARAALAFVALGLVASSTYVLNDVLDRAADRAHPTKRHRPFASGALPVRAAALLVPALLLGAALVAFPLSRGFAALLAAYLVLTVLYSLRLKREPVLDVVVLATLYTLRVFAGGAATAIPVSHWLATFSGALFLSLAFAKRASELALANGEGALPGRGYHPGDRAAVLAMGVASGYLSVLVLALYVESEEVRRMYARPALLWALCPIVLYWVSRLWVRVQRGGVHDDPVQDALTDVPTWTIAAAIAGLLYLAS